MSESCFIIPAVKTPEGKFVDSKLFKDLWKASGNYEWAEKQYKIATNEEFLSSLEGEDVVFDRNGQISARSFMDITGVTFSSDEIKKKLSDKWEDNSLPTQEVPDRVSEFNAREELKDDFIPVIEEEGEIVKFKVAQRNPDRVVALQTYLENNAITKLISDRLRDLGVAYDFIGQQDRFEGRFSTKNADNTFDGFYHLIEIADGADPQGALVEEAAHLATLACENSVFINRLLNAINERNIDKLFTKEELEGVDLNSKDAKLELAGKLVARALKREAVKDYSGFLGNIRNAITKVFSKVNLASLLSAKQRALTMAERLAHGFLYEDNFSAEEAVKNKPATELYLSKPITAEAKMLKSTLDLVKKLGARVNTVSSVAYSAVYKQLTEKSMIEDKDEDYSTITETESVGMMGSAVNVLIERLDTLLDPLKELGDSFFEQDVDVDNINRLYEADSIFKTLTEILNLFNQFGIGADKLTSSSSKDILEYCNKISEKLSGVQNSIESFKRNYSIHLMRDFIGKDVIDLAADVHSQGIKVVAREQRSYSIQELIRFYNDEFTDSNPYLTFIRTYSNQKDVTTQAFYNVVRKAKAVEAINYNQKISDLIELEDSWKDIIKDKHVRKAIERYGFDPDVIFYERLDDGSFTGYFTTDRRTGQAYRDLHDLENKAKDVFAEMLNSEEGYETIEGAVLHMADFKRLNKEQRWSVFNDFLTNIEAYQKLKKAASSEAIDEAIVEYKNTGRKTNSYVNYDFIDLCKEQPDFASVYEQIVKYKRSIDVEFLTDITTSGGGRSHGVDFRIPQFRAGFVERLNSKKYITDKDLYDSRNFSEYCRDVTSDDFGSPITEDVSFKGDSPKSNLDLRKLALYGINMLENPQDISKDIFKNLELYTEMACRFNTSQRVVGLLEVFDSQLRDRELSSDARNNWRQKKKEWAKETATNSRTQILDTFVYAKDKTFWDKVLSRVIGPLGAFAAIRALCISPLSGLKNFFAGYRVVLQDAAAGLIEDVTVKDVLKSTLQNLKPQHLVGEVGRVLYGHTMTYDRYQQLLDRWDSYRTPNKIHRRKGFYPLQTLTNIIMSNYSTTDNAIVGIIYYSRLNKVKLWNAHETNRFGRPTKLRASHSYTWDYQDVKKWEPAGFGVNYKRGDRVSWEGRTWEAMVDGVDKEMPGTPESKGLWKPVERSAPSLKRGLLKDPNDFTRYNYLRAALDSIQDIIKENSQAEDDLTVVLRSLSDSDELRDLEDFYENTGLSPLPIRNSSSAYKNAEDVVNVIQNELDKICFTPEDEFRICNNINDYIISSQGVYGMLNATEFQTNVYTQSLGKIKGYMFGLAQRNFFGNYRASNDKMNHAIMESVRLMLFSTFAGAKELAAEGDISPWQYRWYAVSLCVFPIAFNNKNLIKHMQDCGWDPDQLMRVYSFCLGWFINLSLGILARMLYRGNERTIGNKVYSAKGDMPLKYAKDLGIISLYTKSKKNKVIPPGILFPKEAKITDENKIDKQRLNWKKSHFAKNQNDEKEGYFEEGTKAFDDRYESFKLKNVTFDTKDPLYYMTGFLYRFLRGVRDEGLTLMDPLRYANDATEMLSFGNSILVSSGVASLTAGVAALTGNRAARDKWVEKMAKFYLNKIGLTFDGTPEEGRSRVQAIDWYTKQETIENYQSQREAIPQLLH